ncbi:MAG: Do family serine endopeptidase [Flavobacteriales bacterium]|nr:Do family serine endopeptidase [Flavobacteriales bacterium]
MKKNLSYLVMAILGGVIAIGGYTNLVEKPIVEKREEQPLQTFQTNFKPAFEMTNATYEPTDFTVAAEKTVHAVVHVKNTAVKTGITSFSDIFNGGRKYEQVGTGSGVIISSDGYIVTNNHVIKDATNIEITLNDRKKYEAELIGTDTKNDIALLKVDTDEELPFIPFSNSDNLKIGEWVLAVGNPYNLTSTVTAGIVSAKGRDLQGNTATDSFIQTDAAVNPGNSGGALVNSKGELVGINTAIASRTGSYAGYSFAVPVNIMKKVTKDLMEYGTVQRAFIGVHITEIDQELADELKLDDLAGVYVNRIIEGGAAKSAGINEGDVITKIGNVAINTVPSLQEQIGKFRPGDKISVTVKKDGKEEVKSVTLRNKNGNTEVVAEESGEVMTLLGAQMKPASDKEKKALRITGGVKIVDLSSGKLRAAGIKEGFIITKINSRTVKTTEDITEMLEGKSGGVLIEGIYPNGMKGYYGFGL